LLPDAGSENNDDSRSGNQSVDHEWHKGASLQILEQPGYGNPSTNASGEKSCEERSL
jgi:hypothetical protein